MPRDLPDRGRDLPREMPLVKLIPNLLTLTAVCAGMTAIRFAFQGEYEWAVRMILIAGILDGLDGRLARLLRSQSLIGAELDSLADFLNFGVAPALLLYAWSLNGLGGIGWIAVLCFALCCLLRLARFNVGAKAGGDTAEKTFFTGVPSPAGAVMVLLPMILSFLAQGGWVLPAPAVALYIVMVGLLMISRIPTYSFKNVTIARANARYVLLGTVLMAAALLIYTWATLVVLTLLYMGGIGLAARSWLKTRPPEEAPLEQRAGAAPKTRRTAAGTGTDRDGADTAD